MEKTIFFNMTLGTRDDLGYKMEIRLSEDVLEQIKHHQCPEKIYFENSELSKNIDKFVKRCFKEVEKVSFFQNLFYQMGLPQNVIT